MYHLLKKLKFYGPKAFINHAKNELYQQYYSPLVLSSYSQLNDDIMLDKLLGYPSTGFYVDIGANDPVRFSNTMRFYKKGWSGINIEPSPNKIPELNKKRPKDINLNVGIGVNDRSETFYVIDPDTLSTFSKENAYKYIDEGCTLVDTLSIAVKPLADVLEEHAKDIKISFFNIDTEGYDMNVLKSNDWAKFRPELICIESYDYKEYSDDSKADEQERYLNEHCYKKIYANELNSIYRDQTV